MLGTFLRKSVKLVSTSTKRLSISSATRFCSTSAKPVIEVEVKFKLAPQDEAKIARIAKFKRETKFVDRYFDTRSFALTKNDTWLRLRDSNWECKVPPMPGAGSGKTLSHVDQYRELDTEASIYHFLQQQNYLVATPSHPSGPLLDILVNHGFYQFANIASVRRKYQFGKFNIDLDITDFGYSIGEVELQVEEESEAAQAKREIEQFVHEHGLDAGRIRGKVLEYIFRNNPAHYRALQESGLISDKIKRHDVE